MNTTERVTNGGPSSWQSKAALLLAREGRSPDWRGSKMAHLVALLGRYSNPDIQATISGLGAELDHRTAPWK
jgi:hypothetical protein